MCGEEGCQSVKLLISEQGGKLSLTSSWVLPEQGKSLGLQAVKACTPPQVLMFQCGFPGSTDLCGIGTRGRQGRQENGTCVLSRGMTQHPCEFQDFKGELVTFL